VRALYLLTASMNVDPDTTAPGNFVPFAAPTDAFGTKFPSSRPAPRHRRDPTAPAVAHRPPLGDVVDASRRQHRDADTDPNPRSQRPGLGPGLRLLRVSRDHQRSAPNAHACRPEPHARGSRDRLCAQAFEREPPSRSPRRLWESD
jgi:hypothetical protein